MRSTDTAEFVNLLSDVYGLYPNAKPLTAGQTSMFIRAMAEYPIEAVQSALDAHVKDPMRGRFPPLPADVIAQVQGLVADDGRPGPEEAWSIALQGADESATVVWTTEIGQAWDISRTVHVEGDEVGARMAFRESYNRLVDEARRQRRSPAWSVSLGFDSAKREIAVAKAVELGRITTPEHLVIAGPESQQPLLALTKNPSMPPHVREALQRLREKLVAKTGEPSDDARAKRHTDELQERMNARVNEYVRQDEPAHAGNAGVDS